LKVGSPVTYLGIDIGTIADIHIDPTDINRIVLKLSVETGIPIKEDAVADIVTLSITGMKAIEINGGTNEAEMLAPSSYIEPGRGSLPGEISDKATIIADKVEEILSNLQIMTNPDNITRLSETLEEILGKVSAIIDKGEVEGIVSNTYEFSRQLSEIEIARIEELQ
jgi:phospholipid/cholesterol/gamma-HCH transport system substrate-binding protein